MLQQLHQDLFSLGIEKGDTLLIHASYKALGKIDGGAKAFFDALFSYLGEEGTVVMPALSFHCVTYENPYFNVKETPGCVGYLPEYFRTSVEGVLRSLHASHSCCAKGRLAKEMVANHEKDTTPVGENSPFRKIPYYGGKILFLGCSSNHNTSMHGVEEIADPPFWLDRSRIVEYILEDEFGNQIKRPSYRHDFIIDGQHLKLSYSKIEDMLGEGELQKGKILQADSTVMKAEAVWRKGVEKMKEDPWFFVDDYKIL